MDTLVNIVAIAAFIGIAGGLALAINGSETSRLRNALQLATKNLADAHAETDMLRTTLRIHEDALARRDEELRAHDLKLREAERQRALAHAGELAADAEVELLVAEVANLKQLIDESTLPEGAVQCPNCLFIHSAPPRVDGRGQPFPANVPYRSALRDPASAAKAHLSSDAYDAVFGDLIERLDANLAWQRDLESAAALQEHPRPSLEQLSETALAGLGRPLNPPPAPPRRLTVRIVRSPSTTCWYAGSVGREFEVVEWGRDYVLAIDFDRGPEAAWFHIDKADAEVVR